MSLVTYLRAPHNETETSTRSTALRLCLDDVLGQMVDASDVVLLEVDCPLILGGPVTARRTGHHAPTSSLAVRGQGLPGTAKLPRGSMFVAAPDTAALDQTRAWPAMISFLLDLELARLAAETAARGAMEIANRDPATGLGNRRAWERTLHTESVRAQRTQRPLTLMILDIDGLKAVNDARGHAVGDQLIARVAQALTTMRRATDEICRLGGDEFGIAATDTDEGQARQLATRIRQGLKDVGVRVSLGFAVSTGDCDPHDLWQQADVAMYDDKRTRRPSWEAMRLEAELASEAAVARMPRP